MSSLKEGDAAGIARVAGVERLSPVVGGGAQVVAGNQNWQTRVQGVRPEYQLIQNWQVAMGGFFTDEDDGAARNVAVLGQTVAQNLFAEPSSAVGNYVRIRNVPCTVVGVLASKGSGFGGDQDDVVFIPFETAQVRLFGSTALNSIVIQATSADQMTQLTADIQALLRERHRIRSGQADDFTIRNNNDLLQTVESVTQTLTMLLAGVAAVSLVVGGIGIMNIMLVSVTERTREIGIRMAVGARGGDILAQFLIESVVLSSVGGLIGIGVGVAMAYGARAVFGWAILVPYWSMLIAFGFAAMVGIFFGIYPARKAAQLNPIDALRYE
jgi:putative ABC transport system permease protein